MKQPKVLSETFKPETYTLELADKDIPARLKITGRKIGRPSRRVTLHQRGLKIVAAKIIRHDKRAGLLEIPVDRINTHKSLQELRLHSDEMIYPGEYEIQLEYLLPADKISRLNAGQLNRELLPCVDEPEAWPNAKVEIRR